MAEVPNSEGPDYVTALQNDLQNLGAKLHQEYDVSSVLRISLRTQTARANSLLTTLQEEGENSRKLVANIEALEKEKRNMNEEINKLRLELEETQGTLMQDSMTLEREKLFTQTFVSDHLDKFKKLKLDFEEIQETYHTEEEELRIRQTEINRLNGELRRQNITIKDLKAVAIAEQKANSKYRASSELRQTRARLMEEVLNILKTKFADLELILEKM
ncbi:uncharacterized protein LOC143465481 [Clavelina lepadiformis]|uniref:uncharacterized protein LOC143465481 n=1 Tax=Clavelina lepadiformis TaxID=159417 RepID=UPI004041F104